MHRFEYVDSSETLARHLGEVGVDATDPRMRQFADLWHRMQDLPRHLGQHSGGMVICQDRLDQVVPLENASMPGRVVVQWDKEDCADMGLIKVDLLGLGMMSVLQDALVLVNSTQPGSQVHGFTAFTGPGTRHSVTRSILDLAHLPAGRSAGLQDAAGGRHHRALPGGVARADGDACRGSSRPASTTSSCRWPSSAPAPSSGRWCIPYLNRRAGPRAGDVCPSLARADPAPHAGRAAVSGTVAAHGDGRPPGSPAVRPKSCVGRWGSSDRRNACASSSSSCARAWPGRGITGEAAEQIITSIASFALYGFPESHAASFAHIAYASAYLKAHYPAVFYTALLNNQPMGFYHPATLVKDAQRHGVHFAPVDVEASGLGLHHRVATAACAWACAMSPACASRSAARLPPSCRSRAPPPRAAPSAAATTARCSRSSARAAGTAARSSAPSTSSRAPQFIADPHWHRSTRHPARVGMLL